MAKALKGVVYTRLPHKINQFKRKDFVKRMTTQKVIQVCVLDQNNIPLMPTQRLGKVYRLLKTKKAHIVNYEPFTIKLSI